MSNELLIFVSILEIVILVVSIIFIVLSLFKQTSTSEALSSISGGSQELFLNKKTKLSTSILWVTLIFLALFLTSLIITLRIIVNILDTSF